VDELAGKHGDEHDADEVSGARGQHANQAVDRTSSQIYWLYGQRLGCIRWSRRPSSISDLWPLLLLIG
jgi:hypothetical protein